MKKFFVLLAVAACQPVTSDTYDHEDWCKNNFCMTEATVFTAAGEGMSELLHSSLERVKYATGRFDITTDIQTGIPVLWVEPGSIVDDNGDQVCGLTDLEGWIHGGRSIRSESSEAYTQRIRIARDMPFCPPNDVVLLHELIHALAPKARHVSEGEPSIFNADGARSDYLDEPAMTVLCSHFDCHSFEPEERAPMRGYGSHVEVKP